MRQLMVFNQVTLDGYFADEKGDIGWAHRADANDAEWKAFGAENAKGGGALLFGRITYELMASYWPTPQAMQDDPAIATQMNALPKVVFSRTLDQVSWNNTKVVKSDIGGHVRRMKEESGKHLTILGSGSIVRQLAQDGLIDEYQLVVNPIVLGKGRTMFDGVTSPLTVKPTQARTFHNGNVLLVYESMAVGART